MSLPVGAVHVAVGVPALLLLRVDVGVAVLHVAELVLRVVLAGHHARHRGGCGGDRLGSGEGVRRRDRLGVSLVGQGGGGNRGGHRGGWCGSHGEGLVSGDGGDGPGGEGGGDGEAGGVRPVVAVVGGEAVGGLGGGGEGEEEERRDKAQGCRLKRRFLSVNSLYWTTMLCGEAEGKARVSRVKKMSRGSFRM